MESKRLADYLIDLPGDKVRTVAYIASGGPRRRRHDRPGMRPDRDASPRGAGRAGLRADVARPDHAEPGRDPRLVGPAQAAVLVALGGDVRSATWTSTAATRLGDVDYFCDEELQEPAAAARQGRERPACGKKANASPRPARSCSLSGDKAKDYGIATAVVENFTQFKQHYTWKRPDAGRAGLGR